MSGQLWQGQGVLLEGGRAQHVTMGGWTRALTLWIKLPLKGIPWELLGCEREERLLALGVNAIPGPPLVLPGKAIRSPMGLVVPLAGQTVGVSPAPRMIHR